MTGGPPAAHILTLIRHPETTANVAKLLQGSTDSPLSVHGQNQLNALVKSIRAGLSSEGESSYAGGQGKTTLCALLAGVRPKQIWSSPLPRALQLAKAIQAAYEDKGEKADGTAISLTARSALEERSFGARECCRKGLHVSGFPHGSKAEEKQQEWSGRVKEEGLILLDELVSHPSSTTHLVVVSHGLWISNFLEQFVKAEKGMLPFTDNTGIYTLSVDDKKAVRVVSANEICHLTGLKRQRGGIGSSASDKRQKTLGHAWAKASKARLDDAKGNET